MEVAVNRQAAANPLAAHEPERMHAWWRWANYLSVGQVYLLDNPLLREPLAAAHLTPRLLGHFGTVLGRTLSTCTSIALSKRGTSASLSSPVPGMVKKCSRS